MAQKKPTERATAQKKPALGSNLKSIMDDANKSEKDKQSKKMLNDIAAMLSRKGIDISEVGTVNKVSLYQTVTKDEDGNTQVHDLQAIQFSPAWETGPEWPVVTQGPSIQLQKPKTKAAPPKGWHTAVIVPDIQIGFYRKSLDDYELEPIHDEKAIAVALEVIREMQPQQVVMVGDNLDFAEFGKYLTAAPFKQLVQASIDRATMLCAQMREAAPHAEITWIAGNHEARMARYIQTNAEAAFGITRGKVDKFRENWPVLSVPFLCRMDEFDVKYLPGYPESAHYINSNLVVVHGDKVVSNNSTTKKYLDNERISVIYGHIHRNELAYRTYRTDHGPRTIMAASPGCLCRVDGAVPSTKSGMDEFGRPILQGAENWQQGLGIVTYQPFGVGDEWFNYEPMWIYNGRGILRGKEYKAL
jgi:metallophosphoesterase superfamily enzyme